MNLDYLAQLATEATPGKWFNIVNDLIGGRSVGNLDQPLSQYDFRDRESGHREIADCVSSEDAAFIAAANPSVVLALVEVARAAQKWLDADEDDMDDAPFWDSLSDVFDADEDDMDDAPFWDSLSDVFDALAKLDNLGVTDG